jgi:methylmalonyl-CoA mutase, C-terminal domain
VLGGTIPEQDAAFLKENGVSAIFGPGTSLESVVRFIRENVKAKGVEV